MKKTIIVGNISANTNDTSAAGVFKKPDEKNRITVTLPNWDILPPEND